ncbi:AbrB/MazE/SpoVT family DNA-binding domain-containing protein [Candidatus Daviesbacteria bacterium]|nr:AbrB/MazE/SpoVT family DNA-binding domain-containing protein [Candidatus Daviesbacteria bacterium]
MITTLIAIGNSRGVRIPKPLLEESGLGKDVELRVKKGEIKITSPKKRKASVDPLTLASEAAFAKDWLRPEEEEAWEVYQSDK